MNANCLLISVVCHIETHLVTDYYRQHAFLAAMHSSWAIKSTHTHTHGQLTVILNINTNNILVGIQVAVSKKPILPNTIREKQNIYTLNVLTCVLFHP